MKDRIKKIRKDHKLTQVKFGEIIGVKGNTVTGYETGLRNPTDSVLLSICREFGVNEYWLRTGDGDMYKEPDDETAAVVSDLLEENNAFYDLIISIMGTYRKLTPKSQKALENLSQELLDVLTKKEG